MTETDIRFMADDTTDQERTFDLLQHVSRLLPAIYLAALFAGATTAAQIWPGKLDDSFDPASGPNGIIYTLALQPDQKILVAGTFTRFAGEPRAQLARLNVDGTLDATFDPRPGVVAALQNQESYSAPITVLRLQPDGKILLGGIITNYAGVAVPRLLRVDPDGTLDPTFNFDGATTYGKVGDILPLEDGRFVLGTTWTDDGKSLLLLGPTGHMESHLGDGLIRQVQFITPESPGVMLLAGDFGPREMSGDSRNLLRINLDGSWDTNFLTRAPVNLGPSGVVVQPDGKILISSGWRPANLIRLLSDGSIDPDFTPKIEAGVPYRSPQVNAIALDQAQRVLVGGSYGTIDGQPRSCVALLLPNGRLDPSFSPGGGCTGGLDWYGPAVYGILVQEDGRILIAGVFAAVDGIPVSA